MQEFDVFGPKAIACINGVDGPLATRCVGVQMIRSAPDSPRPRRRVDRNPSWAFACYGRKVKQALAYRKAGSRMLLVYENDFWDAVAEAEGQGIRE